MIRFVTGTDTGVGKTVASAVLARESIAAGLRTRYVKPLQTGLAPDERGSDADLVREWSGAETHELDRFPEPLAPSVAAARAGARINLEELVRRTREFAHGIDTLLVEGAGGLLVPITEEQTMASFAEALDAELVIVCRPGLGTLNHTALTLEAARRRGLPVSELVVSGWPADPGVTERTNLHELRRHDLPVRVITWDRSYAVAATGS